MCSVHQPGHPAAAEAADEGKRREENGRRECRWKNRKWGRRKWGAETKSKRGVIMILTTLLVPRQVVLDGTRIVRKEIRKNVKTTRKNCHQWTGKKTEGTEYQVV